MTQDGTQWDAPDLFDEIDRLRARNPVVGGIEHEKRMIRIGATTSIPIRCEADVARSCEAARRMGGFCRLSERRLSDLDSIVSELADSLVENEGGFLRLSPVPGTTHLAVLVESEGAAGRSRCLVDETPVRGEVD